MSDSPENSATPAMQAPTKGAEEYPTVAMSGFFQDVPPGSWRSITSVWCDSNEYGQTFLHLPVLTLHCPPCDGKRYFDPTNKGPWVPKPDTPRKPNEARFTSAIIRYHCRNCATAAKQFAVSIDTAEKRLLKFGEEPTFGHKVSRRVLNVFGEDKDVLLKGKQCENHGLGVGAFAYYRRLVEKQRNALFDLIISVAETNGDKAIVTALTAARAERQFEKSFEMIGESVPQSIKVDGQNPLTILYAALSEGIHGLTDEECLSRAQAARTVLELVVTKVDTALAEREGIKKALGQLTRRASKVARGPFPEPTGPAVPEDRATVTGVPSTVSSAEEEKK